MLKQIVLISGKQGSGKTTLQHKISSKMWARHFRAVESVNFADTIYKIHDFAKNTFRELDLVFPDKDGSLLQVLGTEWGRKTRGESVWVDVVRKRILKSNRDTYVIGDCRFENEFKAFPEALRVRLVASKDARKLRCSGWRDNDTHPSEVGLDHVDDSEFDMVFNTEEMDADSIAELVIAQLQKNNWREKRGKSL